MIERAVDYGFEKHELCIKNNIAVEYEQVSLADLKRQHEEATDQIVAQKAAVRRAMNNVVDGEAAVKVDDIKVNVDSKERELEAKILGILQDTSFAPRAAPPEEFFSIYASSKILLPSFVLFLVIVLFTRIISSIFY